MAENESVTSGSLSASGPNPVAGWSPDDYNEALNTELGGEDPPAGQHALSFWERTLHRGKEMIRSAARGVEKAGIETAETAGTVLQKVPGARRIGKAVVEGSQVAEQVMNQTLGRRSDDTLAEFTEGAAQFAAGWAATGPLMKGGSLLTNMARGAVVDFSVFDPMEGGLSELAAKAPVPIVKQLGELLSVDADDGAIVARLKRVGEGLVAGASIDALVASARILRASKRLRGGANGAAKVAHEATIAKESQVLQDIADGKHVAEGEAVAVKPAEGGTFTLEAKDPEVVFPDLPEETLKFSDRAEAAQQASVINMAINARRASAHTVTAGEAWGAMDMIRVLKGEATEEELVEQMAQQGHFNPSYMATGKESVSAIDAISSTLGEWIDKAQAHPHGIRVDDSIERSNRLFGLLTEENASDAVKGMLTPSRGLHVKLYAANMLLKYKGSQLAKLSDILTSRPHDVIAHEEARHAIQNFFDFTKEVAGANSEVGRALRMLQERANAAGEVTAESFKKGEAKAAGKEAATNGKGIVAPEPAQMTAGMTHREIRAIARMQKLAGPKPKNIYAVIHGARVLKQEGAGSKFMEFFANALLSGPKTVLTALASGVTTSAFEPVARTLAGAATLNKPLAREGADILFGHFAYLKDNLASAAAALREGRSIINPQEQRIAIGGLTGKIIRMPGRALAGMDEFVRVANYRSFVRAKSLRIAREEGLSGLALHQRVEDDLRAAFDKSTGIATLGEASQYAEVPTFSGPLDGKLGEKFHEYTNNSFAAKFIAPFVKASANIFDYAWASTPGLNVFNKGARETMKRGGEEAAVLHTRSLMAGSIYGMGLLQALSGNLTGRAPSDPELRAAWLKDHQPYSVRVGGKWVSYRRADPLGAPLGIMGDLVTSIHELGQDDTDVQELAIATVSGLTASFASKTYMSGVTQFADAWGSGDVAATERWVRNFAGNLAVPQLFQAINPDNYYREVQSIGDAIHARIPGWSKTLPPRFNAWGEPIQKAAGVGQRAVNPYTIVAATNSTADEALLELGKGLTPPPKKIEGGLIDLLDARFAKNGKLPYVRLMELIRSPGNGDPSFRKGVEELVKSDSWNEMSDGTEEFPGGKRWIKLMGLRERAYNRAMRSLLDEYPQLDTEIRKVRKIKGAAIRSGESGVAEVEALFGK